MSYTDKAWTLREPPRTMSQMGHRFQAVHWRVEQIHHAMRRGEGLAQTNYLNVLCINPPAYPGRREGATWLASFDAMTEEERHDWYDDARVVDRLPYCAYAPTMLEAIERACDLYEEAYGHKSAEPPPDGTEALD